MYGREEKMWVGRRKGAGDWIRVHRCAGRNRNLSVTEFFALGVGGDGISLSRPVAASSAGTVGLECPKWSWGVGGAMDEGQHRRRTRATKGPDATSLDNCN